MPFCFFLIVLFWITTKSINKKSFYPQCERVVGFWLKVLWAKTTLHNICLKQRTFHTEL